MMESFHASSQDAQPGRSEEELHSVFEQFYAHNVVFELTRQWTAAPGHFAFPFRWLSQSAHEDDIRSYAESTFKSVFDVNLSDVIVV